MDRSVAEARATAVSRTIATDCHSSSWKHVRDSLVLALLKSFFRIASDFILQNYEQTHSRVFCFD